MKKFFYSFIDTDFLKEFVDQMPTDLMADNDSLDIWRNFLKFIRHNTIIDLETDFKSLKDLDENDPIFWILKHIIFTANYADNTILLNTQKLQMNSPKQIIDEGLTTKFIFKNSLLNINSIDFSRTGYFSFKGNEIIKKWGSVIHRPKLSTIINKNAKIATFRHWYDFQIYSHPLNSIIIIDNYLCNYPLNLENNIFPLLKILLPKTDLYTTLDIMIITSEFYIDRNTRKEVGISIITTKIQNFLTKLNLRNCRLSIIKSEVDKYHDRHIFTNNFVIKSGYPFSICDENDKVRLDTPVEFTVESLVEKNSENQSNAEYYNDFLKYIKNEIVMKAKIHTKCIENRLLDCLT